MVRAFETPISLERFWCALMCVVCGVPGSASVAMSAVQPGSSNDVAWNQFDVWARARVAPVLAGANWSAHNSCTRLVLIVHPPKNNARVFERQHDTTVWQAASDCDCACVKTFNESELFTTVEGFVLRSLTVLLAM